MGEIHELFVLALALVWFAGATPDSRSEPFVFCKSCCGALEIVTLRLEAIRVNRSNTMKMCCFFCESISRESPQFALQIGEPSEFKRLDFPSNFAIISTPKVPATNLGVFDLRHFALLKQGCANLGRFGACCYMGLTEPYSLGI